MNPVCVLVIVNCVQSVKYRPLQLKPKVGSPWSTFLWVVAHQYQHLLPTFDVELFEPSTTNSCFFFWHLPLRVF
ncbi:unnamed protein product [Pieris macdunnoughi]|uniref:Uncharacterized protein n=1 Tax=Pieris macdunnoughi TaxID=345717 RepID=A0A821L373_9NEOP|nr:unnamed protein product [Pieris macdunnoughi]